MTLRTHIFLVLTLLWAIATASAQQVTVFPPASLPLSGAETMYLIQGGHSKQTQIGNITASTALPVINAAAFGVVADGVTSNDQALGLALAACTKIGAQLVLPPGNILLTGASITGNATRTLTNCGVVGAGVPAAVGTGISGGTTISLTSPSVAPFTCRFGWSMQGVSFLWPGTQTGTTFYPPAITDDGVHQCGHAFIDHVTITNAYDGIVGSSGVAWGNIHISNSTIYAVHEALSWGTIGDSILVANVAFSPGPWLTWCNFTCTGAVDNATHNNGNAPLTVTAGGIVNINIDSNTYAEAWRYGIHILSGGTLGESNIQMNYDGVGTWIQVDSGGTYAIQNTFSGSGNCFLADFTGSSGRGHNPCFNLSSTSGLYVNNVYIASAFGDVFDLNGGYLRARNIEVDSVGSIADGGQYDLVNLVSGTAASIILQDSSFAGLPSNANVHGVVTGSNVPINLKIENNSWIYFNDEIDAQTASATTSILGNTSTNTNGTASVALNGTNPVSYGLNWWDAPPTIALGTNCDGSGTATSQGFLNGHVFLGASGAITACTITFPFKIAPGLGYTCIGQLNNGNLVAGGPSGNQFAFTFADSHGGTLFYMCGGLTN